jgi:predicted nucleotidyltransferase
MGKVNLFPDFRELLESLNSAKAKYLIVGGYAVNLHGHHRATRDLDIWIATDPENADKVSAALRAFGFAPSKVKSSMLQQPRQVFVFGREPARVDLLTTTAALDFEAAYTRRRVVNWDGVEVPVVSLEDLKVNKQAAGRPKDLADIANLPASSDTKPQRRKRRN